MKTLPRPQKPQTTNNNATDGRLWTKPHGGEWRHRLTGYVATAYVIRRRRREARGHGFHEIFVTLPNFFRPDSSVTPTQNQATIYKRNCSNNYAH